jgi:hypothetical protein
MLVEHFKEKRQQKKALTQSASFQPISAEEARAVRGGEVKWVDEKQKLPFPQERNGSRDTMGTELPTYGQVMKEM